MDKRSESQWGDEWGDGPNGEGGDWRWTAESQQAQSDDYEKESKNPDSKPSNKELPWDNIKGRWDWDHNDKPPF